MKIILEQPVCLDVHQHQEREEAEVASVHMHALQRLIFLAALEFEGDEGPYQFLPALLAYLGVVEELVEDGVVVQRANLVLVQQAED